MSEQKTRDVLGFGCATIDELLYVDEWPERERKIPIRHLEAQGGGLGATALVAAARLGAQCAYAGMLGFDDTSKRVAQILENENIDMNLVSWHEEAGAIRAFVVVDTSHNSRNIFFKRPLLVGTPPDAPSEAEVAASKCAFVDHYGGEGTVRLCEIARRVGVPVVADVERIDVPAFEAFFPLVPHPILSQGFASRLTNEERPAAMVRALWNEYREVVVVTCGENGAFFSEDGREVAHFPAFATEVVDTTGCGDCFHGAYCATLAWGFSLEERIRWASAAASLKASVAGAQKGLPRREAVETLLGVTLRG
ncbi:sulfofructose kinase [Abditibacteriota bacterium]|nr:sulfofructose kinase [Abditibacteriota bacterium]